MNNQFGFVGNIPITAIQGVNANDGLRTGTDTGIVTGVGAVDVFGPTVTTPVTGKLTLPDAVPVN